MSKWFPFFLLASFLRIEGFAAASHLATRRSKIKIQKKIEYGSYIKTNDYSLKIFDSNDYCLRSQ